MWLVLSWLKLTAWFSWAVCFDVNFRLVCQFRWFDKFAFQLCRKSFLLLNLFLTHEKNTDFLEIKLQTSILLRNFLRLWPNWKARSICGWMWQKICCHKNVLSSETALKVKDIKLQKLNFSSWKFTILWERTASLQCFTLPAYASLSRGVEWLFRVISVSDIHLLRLSLAAVYKKFLALKLHEHCIAVFAVFAMFIRFSITIF